jgi:UDPglucose 6-dehydrogenase
MRSLRRRVCIVGTGYIGVATAIGLAELGHDVTGYDITRERVVGLAAGVTPYRETGLGARLKAQLTAGNVHFFESLEHATDGADFIIICVGTPSMPDGAADLSALDVVVTQLGALPLGDATVVLRSTVPCGTTDKVDAALWRQRVLYAPEFLREGRALEDFLNPDRIVIGATSSAAALEYAALFSGLTCPVITTTYRDAELIKAYSNVFLAMKISFANEVANFCDEAGADAPTVLEAIGADKRIGAQFLHPGIGFGGPCFEKDLRSVQRQAANFGVESALVSTTLRINQCQPVHIVDMLEESLGGLNGFRIAVWGLTFKAGTDDVRDSLALRIVDDLRRRGAHVVAYDPAVPGPHTMVRCELASSALAAIDGADGLLVLTEWSEFAAIAPREIHTRLRHKVVVDGRNLLDGAALAATGVRYRGVGRRIVENLSVHEPLPAAAV